MASQAGSEFAANSGRWVKLTKESAELVKKHGLRESKKTGRSSAVLKGPKGQIKGFVEFTKAPGAALTNPALLAGVGGVMAQLAMQQAMDEITDYLARIDAKVDDVLRAQKDAVLSQMIGAGLIVDEAMTVREHVGSVNEVMWSKVQAVPTTIAETQSYALRQLDALAEKLERGTKVDDLAEAAEEAETKAQEWLAVLARCFQLQDAIAVIELDRVLEVAPDTLDSHRLGLKAARQDRLRLIARTTEELLARLDAAAATANSKVLLHPSKAPKVGTSSNQVAITVGEFHELLGMENDRLALEPRRWTEAATEVRSRVLETGAVGVDAVRRVGAEGLDRTRSTTVKLSRRLGDLPLPWRGDDGTRDQPD